MHFSPFIKKIIFLSFFCVKFIFAQENLIYNYDLLVKSTSLQFDNISNQYIFTVNVYNNGTKAASNFDLLFYVDSDSDSLISSPDSQIWKETFNDTLSPKDSIIRTISFKQENFGLSNYIFFIDFKLDSKLSNNYAFLELYRSYPQNTIVINEIMFNPLVNQSEYIELYNRSDEKINLFNWKMTDQRLPSGSRNEFTINRNLFIEPNGYFLISCDTNIFSIFPYLKDSLNNIFIVNRTSLSLNNDEDDVILFDYNKMLVDSVRYNQNWHNTNVDNSKGISLERIDPNLSSIDKNNWTSSLNKSGGSPNRKNTIPIKPIISNSKIEISPNPFSPDSDGFEDACTISYAITNKFSKIRVRIFDPKGRMIRTLANNEYAGSEGKITWDGLDDQKQKVRIGIYILFFETLDDLNGSVQFYKNTVVVAAKL